LSDAAIADFLLFGQPVDNAATCFTDIGRVPPAHVLTISGDGRHEMVPYWRLEAPVPVHHRDGRDYVDQFHDTLRRAVLDRVTEPSVAVLMSGGLDSSSVAALAAGLVGAPRCEAVTAVYERAFHDDERTFSRAAAAHIGIANTHVPVDGCPLFAGWDADFGPAEPTTEPLTAIMQELLGVAARRSTVVLGGEGGDPILLPGAVSRQVGRMPFRQLVHDVGAAWRRGLWPPLGVKSRILRRVGRRQPRPPEWVSARLVRAADTDARWSAYHRTHVPGCEARAEALAALRHPIWPALFESRDPAATGLPAELRYPFFDQRVVSLGLALPSYPWCLDKSIVRDAMIGHLPDTILRRPKTPLGGNPIDFRQWPADRLAAEVASAEGLAEFVDVAAFRRDIMLEPSWSARPGVLEIACLARWLNLQTRRAQSVA
jgi:asparagine synthase (glutamine-hydrolysing)